MTDAQLAGLSTIAWIIGTSTLFVLLAHWSAGGSWGISSAIARGLTGWAGRAGGPTDSGSAADLPPMRAPRLDRLWGDRPDGSVASATTSAATISSATQPTAELQDLGTRRLE